MVHAHLDHDPFDKLPGHNFPSSFAVGFLVTILQIAGFKNCPELCI